MGVGNPQHSPVTPALTRAAHDTHARRRRQIARRALLLVGVTAALLVVSMMTRDLAEGRAQRALLEFAVRELERQASPGCPAPVPLTPTPGVSSVEAFLLRDRVDWNLWYSERRSAADVVGVCVYRDPHRRFLRPDGRYAVVWRPADNRYEVEWIPEVEFPERAAALGFTPVRR